MCKHLMKMFQSTQNETRATRLSFWNGDAFWKLCSTDDLVLQYQLWDTEPLPFSRETLHINAALMLGCILSCEQVILHVQKPMGAPQQPRRQLANREKTSSQRHHGHWRWIFPFMAVNWNPLPFSYHLKPLRVWDSNLFGKSTYQNPI